MYVLTRSEYQRILDGIHTHPFTFPPLSMKEELDKYDAYYLSWAIWCVYGLPKPKNEKEQASLDMLVDYITKNLEIVDDDKLGELEEVKW